MKKPPAKGAHISTQPTEHSVHPAIREIRLGRGYGVTIVPVVDFVRFTGVATLHVLEQFKRSTLCGTGGGKKQLQLAYEECDPKALIVGGQPVCARCRNLLGHVPMPRLVSDDQGDQ